MLLFTEWLLRLVCRNTALAAPAEIGDRITVWLGLGFALCLTATVCRK